MRQWSNMPSFKILLFHFILSWFFFSISCSKCLQIRGGELPEVVQEQWQLFLSAIMHEIVLCFDNRFVDSAGEQGGDYKKKRKGKFGKRRRKVWKGKTHFHGDVLANLTLMLHLFIFIFISISLASIGSFRSATFPNADTDTEQFLKLMHSQVRKKKGIVSCDWLFWLLFIALSSVE